MVHPKHELLTSLKNVADQMTELAQQGKADTAEYQKLNDAWQDLALEILEYGYIDQQLGELCS
jgi:hypothetical protein